MFYKIRNVLLVLLSLVMTHIEAEAQGLVSLSEEAMFEDELDTELNKPENNKNETAEVPVVKTDEVGLRENKSQKNEEIAQKVEEPKVKDSAFLESVEPSDKKETTDESFLQEDVGSDLYNTLDNQTNLKGTDVFEHMSDIEKRTAILNLELRREKLQDEIEAVKYKRREALAREKQKEEDQRLKNLEAEKEIERKRIKEGNYTLKSKVLLKHPDPKGLGFTIVGSGEATLSEEGIRYIGTINDEQKDILFKLENIPALPYGVGENFEIYHDQTLYYFIPENIRHCVKWSVVEEQMYINLQIKNNKLPWDV